MDETGGDETDETGGDEIGDEGSSGEEEGDKKEGGRELTEEREGREAARRRGTECASGSLLSSFGDAPLAESASAALCPVPNLDPTSELMAMIEEAVLLLASSDMRDVRRSSYFMYLEDQWGTIWDA